MALPPENPCVVCSAPGTRFCVQCIGPYAVPITEASKYNQRWYCSADCEEKDRDQHDCKEMRNMDIFHQAVRAGAVAQSLFLALLEKTWAFPFDEPMMDDWDNLIVPAAADESSGRNRAGGWFTNFDWKKFENIRRQGYDMAGHTLLVDKNSVWAFVAAHHAVMCMFETLCNNVLTDIKEFTHALNPKLRRIITYTQGHSLAYRFEQIYADFQEMRHNEYGVNGIGVFEITLKTGQVIALDLCGQQFNHEHLKVRPWAEYWGIYGGGEIKQRSPLGKTWNDHRLLMTNFDSFSHITISTSLVNQLGHWIEGFKHSEQGINPLTALLWMKDDAEFAVMAKRLNIRACAFLDNTIAAITNSPTSLELDFPIPKDGINRPDYDDERDSIFYSHGRTMLFGTGVNAINWDGLKNLAKDPKTSLDDRREARDLLSVRCVYAPWGDQRIILLKDSVPKKGLRADQFSINPYWDPSRKN